MKTQILYYAEGCGSPFYDEASAIAEEARHKDRQAYWATNSAAAKLDKLINDLKRATEIHPQTIATCSFESLAVKAMVKVCGDFHEQNKHYLQYY